MRVALASLLILATGSPVMAETPLEAARTLLAAWHADPSRLDRARGLLEAAAAEHPTPEVLVELAGAWLLTGDFRARSDAERLAAYERGAAAARQAIALAPRNERAHLLHAFNLGRRAQMAGVMRALTTLATVRDESETVLRLNASSVDGLILAAGIAAEVPSLMGGDRGKAESLFLRALALDPHHTSARVELARLYLAMRRWADGARELRRVMDEAAPTDPSRWVLGDLPRARAMLHELQEQGRLPGLATQSP